MAQDDGALRARLRDLSRDRPRWGYRRAHPQLRDEGWTVNRKRVQRLWREEGLRVRVRRRKRYRLGESTVPAKRLAAQRPNHVWALVFQFDQTADGQILTLLHIVMSSRGGARCPRERRIDADRTVGQLERLVGVRGAPEDVRRDNGAELTANAPRDWCRFSKTGSAYIDLGSPWQKPLREVLRLRNRDELLAVEHFSCLLKRRSWSPTGTRTIAVGAALAGGPRADPSVRC